MNAPQLICRPLIMISQPNMLVAIDTHTSERFNIGSYRVGQLCFSHPVQDNNESPPAGERVGVDPVGYSLLLLIHLILEVGHDLFLV